MITADFIICKALVFRAVGVFKAEKKLITIKTYKDLLILSFKGVK